jgi:hypothetical protein
MTMKNRTLTLTAFTLTAFLVVLVFTHGTAGAQTAGGETNGGTRFNATARLKNGIYVGFSTEADQRGALPVSFSSIETGADNVIHRVLVDKEGIYFYGYDLGVEILPDSKQFRISVRPLSDEFGQRLRERKSFASRRLSTNADAPALSQRYQEQVINDGDMVAIDVLVNQKTGVKIVDIIKVSSEQINVGGASLARSPARDFSLDDIELKVTNYRLLVNNELVAGAVPTGGCSGSIIWFYLPGRGRFIFSIKPRQGYDFQKIGVIENNKISFSFGGDQYQWVSSSPIVGSTNNFNVWVLHDSVYTPELQGEVTAGSARYKDRSPVIIGAADSIELMLPKK